MLYYASMYVPQMACFCVFFIFVPFIQLCWLQWITWTWILALFFWKKTFFLGLNRWSMIHKIKSLIWARLISPFFNTSFELNFKVLNLLKKLGRICERRFPNDNKLVSEIILPLPHISTNQGHFNVSLVLKCHHFFYRALTVSKCQTYNI